MNASELYAIVKDVPKEAWPDISWCNGAWFETDRDGLIHRHSLSLEVETSVLMFEASMMRWLISQGHHEFTWDPGNKDGDATTLTLYSVAYPAPTILEGLAAACKAVAQ